MSPISTITHPSGALPGKETLASVGSGNLKDVLGTGTTQDEMEGKFDDGGLITYSTASSSLSSILRFFAERTRG